MIIDIFEILRGISKDNTIYGDTLMFISNDTKQKYPFIRIKLLVKKFGYSKNQLIRKEYMLLKLWVRVKFIVQCHLQPLDFSFLNFGQMVLI